jgi:dipeptidyl aminopeptidase/acylaminoacyl peptidase
VLLAHGEDDPLVPVAVSQQFFEALDAGGHPVTLERLGGVDHETVYSPEVSGSLLASWLGLGEDGGQASPAAG